MTLSIILFSGISGKIQGLVLDTDTKEPIPYADVIILDTEIGAATDGNGDFFILNVPPGTYTVEVSYIGYRTKHIKDVRVEIDQTVRLMVSLTQTAIEISPITVTSELPAVRKDYVATTYIVRKTELKVLPVDYFIDLITFQPSVARAESTIHVRGGRATEVNYMIDNVSIIDPQTGDLAINISRGVVDEIIFLPGGFDVEYGRAMSGVINLIAERPSDLFETKFSSKIEMTTPYSSDFGYHNYYSSVHLPVSQRLKGLLSFDLMHTNDWNPRLRALPHKQRDDYAFYSKWSYAPSGKLKLTLSGAKSRTQFDRYDTKWKYHLSHSRSDLKRGDLQALNLSFLPDSRKLFNLTFSRLHSRTTFGTKERNDYGLFDDYAFKDYHTFEWPQFNNRNPFGVYWFLGLPRIHLYDYPIIEGDYPEYQNKSSQIMKASLNTTVQIHKYHEIKAGIEYTHLDLENFIHFVPPKYWFSGDTAELIDRYHYYPKEYSLFFQDNIDYQSLYAKVGCRVDHYETGIAGIDPQTVISPRCGASFMVTEKFLFRANLGLYAQPPLFDYMYPYYNMIPLPRYLYRYLPLVGNPRLRSEKTMSYEIGLQGKVHENLSTTVNLFQKDVYDLIGTRFVLHYRKDYVRYENIEHANIKGCEMILEFADSLFSGKISYTLSWARGTSSYAEEVYDLYNWLESYDTLTYSAEEYYLNFDQRHRIFAQGAINLPLQTEIYIFGYLGVGFPYTPPGAEGKTEERNALRQEFQKQFDCVISKSFKIGKVSLNANLEIVNVLNMIYQIKEHYPPIPLESIDILDFRDDYSLLDWKYYTPPGDKNHDGLLTSEEQLEIFQAFVSDMEDSVNAYTAPRKARVGISINF